MPGLVLKIREGDEGMFIELGSVVIHLWITAAGYGWAKIGVDAPAAALVHRGHNRADMAEMRAKKRGEATT